MKKIVLTIMLFLSLECSAQSFPFGYGTGIKFGCGNDLDLTFTGSMFIVAGSGLYSYGYYRVDYLNNYSDKQYVTIQNIGISLIITGGVILIEESIRHGIHRNGNKKRW